MARKQYVNEGLGHSLMDLMTSIAVIFILLFLVFLHNKNEEIAIRKRQTTTNLEKLFAQLEGKFSADVVVQKDPDDPLTLLIVLRDDPDSLSFAYNRAEVRRKGRAFLERFIPRLSDIVCSKDAEDIIDSLIIEGHTDSRGSDDTNTDLSARRATAVLIESRGIIAERETGDDGDRERLERCFLHLSQATGRGEQELILDKGVEDVEASRRVVVKIRVKSMEQREDEGEVVEASIGG